MHKLPYTPVHIGEVFGKSRALVFGLAYDPSQTLIALSVQAPSTLAEAVHYDLQGQDHTLTISTRSYSRYVYSRKSHYRVLKKPIPDTTDISLIMLNDSLFGTVKDMHYTHVWHVDVEDFKWRLYHRVREIVYVAVKPEWRTWLYLKGMSTEFERNHLLCNRMVNYASGERGWTAAGFDCGYIANYREAWEDVIAQGLKSGNIEL